jgi:Zn-finger nucleic acid-binding protein
VKCPIDQAELVMAERQGVEIDYCPKCRGVWLDRGELDKIVERAEQFEASRTQYSEPAQKRYRDDDHRHYGRKKRHWLSDLFD